MEHRYMKSIVIPSMSLESNAAIDRFLVQKPPVEQRLIALHMASNRGIPANAYAMKASTPIAR